MNIKIIDANLSVEREEQVARILQSAIAAVDPRKIVRNALAWQENALHVNGMEGKYLIRGDIIMIGAGKAAYPMAMGALDVLGEKINRGTIITKSLPADPTPELDARIQVRMGDHPIPGKDSEEATRRVMETCTGLTEGDLVIFLLSGGASALMSMPLPGLRLEDIHQMTRVLLKCGANIAEMNALRKHVDTVKGGGLARLIYPAKVITLALSDVVGDNPSVIGSGPTVTDESTFQDAQQVIEKYHLEGKLPPSISEIIQKGLRGEIAETIKPGNPILENCEYRIIGSNQIAVKVASDEAENSGMVTINLGSMIQGEAKTVGMQFASFLKNKAEEFIGNSSPICFIGGGETTVTLMGRGRGGRNLETALAAVEGISGMDRACIVTLASDGEDGMTGKAGAVITGETFNRGLSRGFHPKNFLAGNDSLSYFEKVGGLLSCGSTGTNVMDLFLLFLF
jgi:glycerate 2-kinase